MKWQTVLTSLLVATLVGAPSLCMAGVVTHACDCATQRDCHHDDDCGHEDDGCHHEGDCPDDPCSVLAVPAKRLTDLTHEIGKPLAPCLTIGEPGTNALTDAPPRELPESRHDPYVALAIDTTRLLI